MRFPTRSLLLFWSMVLLLRTQEALAQFTLIKSGISGCDFKTGILHAKCIPAYLLYLVQTVFSLAGGIFLIMIIIAGYQIALGSVTGNKEAGKQRLTWAIGGFLISVFSFFIIAFIIGTITGA